MKINIDDDLIKKRSKISMKIEESKNKENIEPEFGDEDDYLSDYEEQEIITKIIIIGI